MSGMMHAGAKRFLLFYHIPLRALFINTPEVALQRGLRCHRLDVP